MSVSFEDYFEKLEKMQRWIKNDLTNASIKAKANFLVAMGIFNYIEILGSFYITADNNTDRFNYAFKNLLNSSYKSLFDDLNGLTKKGAYDCLRCGMTHEYLVKTYNIKNKNIIIEYTVFGVDDNVSFISNILSCKRGIELTKLSDKKYHLRIYNPRLIFDLNLAFEKYKKILLEDNKDYRERFMKRCKEIKLENFN